MQTLTPNEALEAARDQAAEPVQDVVPDVLERPLVDRAAVRAWFADNGMVPWWNSAQDRWERIPAAGLALEAALHEFCEDEQDRLDAIWRSSPAYGRAVDRSLAQAKEAAEDRAYDRARDAKDDSRYDKRVQELIFAGGLRVEDARAQADREFGGK